MADGDVLGILLLARNASLPSCQVCTVISPFRTFWNTFARSMHNQCTINARSALQNRCHYLQLQLSPRSSISQPSASSNSVPGSDVCWVLGMKPLKNQTLSKTFQNYRILRQNDPNFPSQSSYWCLSPRNFGCPIIEAIPNESLDFKALNRAFSRPSRSLFGGGACAKSNSLNVH